MKITDCEHKPGTPEHNAWIKDVFQADAEDRAAHRERYGAESIGGRLIFGRQLYEPVLYFDGDFLSSRSA